MDYKELTNRLVCAGRIEKYYDEDSIGLYTRASTAITDLLARAEAAEARCASLDAVVSEYQEEIIPEFRKLVDKAETRIKKLTDALEREQRRAEKAERERDAYKEMIYKERPCAFCAVYTGEWNTECLSCDRCTKEYRPKFRLRELKEE